jgi:hypothetical protein
MGRHPLPHQRMRVLVGCFTYTADARDAAGMSWMSSDEMAQAIPAAYTLHIASQEGARQCAICHRWWSPKRIHAKTCSPACRKARSRQAADAQ